MTLKRFINCLVSLIIVKALLTSFAVAGPITSYLKPLYTTVDSPENHTISGSEFESDYAGVVDLIIGHNDGNFFRCSGSLISSTQVLTAGHCVSNNRGKNVMTEAFVTFGDFDRTDGIQSGQTIHSTTAYVNPKWRGNLARGGDLAIIELETAVTGVTPYALYDGSDEIGQTIEKAGYGLTGTGFTGSGGLSGVAHYGLNRYDSTGSLFSYADSILMYDFDYDSSLGLYLLDDIDAFNFWFGSSYADLGFGLDEVNSAPGDSGGGSFIRVGSDLLLAGVTSFGLITSYDIDNQVNSSFGEFSGDTRVSSWLTWISDILGGGSSEGNGNKGGKSNGKGKPKFTNPGDYVEHLQIPEPNILIIMALGFITIGLTRRRESQD